jgi:hypothetical protein
VSAVFWSDGNEELHSSFILNLFAHVFPCRESRERGSPSEWNFCAVSDGLSHLRHHFLLLPVVTWPWFKKLQSRIYPFNFIWFQLNAHTIGNEIQSETERFISFLCKFKILQVLSKQIKNRSKIGFCQSIFN